MSEPQIPSRVWLITGCSSGFGLAPASAVLARGQRVIATARHTSALDALAAHFPETCLTLALDVTNSSQVKRVVAQAAGAFAELNAEVDVAFRDIRTIGGIVWPTDFDERIRVPFDLHTQHWRMLGLKINRGFRAADLAPFGLKDRASAPTSTLPAP